jgi:hypothetical protein
MHLAARLAASAALLCALAGPVLGPATAASGSSSPVDITPNPAAAGTRTTFAVNCSSLTAAGPASSATLIGTTLGLPAHIPMQPGTHSNEFVTTVLLPASIKAGSYQPDIDCSNGVTASSTLTVSPGGAPATGDGSTATATDGTLTAAGFGLAGLGVLGGGLLAGWLLLSRRRAAGRG